MNVIEKQEEFNRYFPLMEQNKERNHHPWLVFFSWKHEYVCKLQLLWDNGKPLRWRRKIMALIWGVSLYCVVSYIIGNQCRFPLNKHDFPIRKIFTQICWFLLQSDAMKIWFKLLEVLKTFFMWHISLIKNFSHIFWPFFFFGPIIFCYMIIIKWWVHFENFIRKKIRKKRLL